MLEKEYLGDAVYVEVAKFNDVILTTEGWTGSETNRIVLEPQVMQALDEYLDRAFDRKIRTR